MKSVLFTLFGLTMLASATFAETPEGASLMQPTIDRIEQEYNVKCSEPHDGFTLGGGHSMGLRIKSNCIDQKGEVAVKIKATGVRYNYGTRQQINEVKDITISFVKGIRDNQIK